MNRKPIVINPATNQITPIQSGDTLDGSFIGIGVTPNNLLTRDVDGNLIAVGASLADLVLKADLVGGKVPSAQLPSGIDDIIEVPTFSALPAVGESNIIYLVLDTNREYRWAGTQYAVISDTIALGETSSTAYRGDHGKAAYDHALVVGNAHGLLPADIDLGNVNNTADLDKPISTATQSALGLKQDTLVSGSTIRTLNTLSILGAGDITVDKITIGLGNVDNTSDLDKPVSNATQLVLNSKQMTLISGTNIKTVNNNALLGSGDLIIDKVSVGLANVDNTSDVNKPVSTATQNALNLKQATLVSGTNVKTVNGTTLLGAGNLVIDKTSVGLANVDNTSDINKPVSTATQTALDLKQNTLVSGTNIKTVGGITLLGTGDVPLPARVKTEVVWTGLSLLIPTTVTNFINLIKGITPTTGVLVGSTFFDTVNNKMVVLNKPNSVQFKLSIEGTWSGASTNRSMTIVWGGTVPDRDVKSRNQSVTTDSLLFLNLFSVDVGGNLATNGSIITIQSNGATFTASTIKLIAEQVVI